MTIQRTSLRVLLPVVGTLYSVLISAQEPVVTPTPEEARLQARQIIAVDTTASQFAHSVAVVRDLEERIRAIDSLVSLNAAARIELQRLRAEREREEKAKHEREIALRAEVIPQWLSGVSNLYTGLDAAAGIAPVAEITLFYNRGGQSPWWTNAIDYLGRGFAGIGAAVAIGSDHRGTQVDALRGVGLGAGLYFLGTYLKGKNQSQPEDIRVFVERVSMHRTFSEDVFALNGAVRDLRQTMQPVVLIADAYNGIRPTDPRFVCRTQAFKVEEHLLDQYGETIESYNALVSQFVLTHRRARQLREQSWTDTIHSNLDHIIAATDTAIVRWRGQVLISQNLLSSLRTLAAIDATQPRPACPAPVAIEAFDRTVIARTIGASQQSIYAVKRSIE